MSSRKIAPPGPRSIEVADRLHSAAIHLLRRLRVRDLESGIGPAQLSALSVLVFGGPRSLKELAAAEQVKAPTMSRVVTALAEGDLLRAEIVEEDQRKLRLEATPKGVQLMQESRRRRVSSLARALSALSGDKVRQLADAAEMIDRLSRDL